MNYRTIIGDRKIELEQVNMGKKAWPEFMQHDAIVGKYWPNLYSDFLDYQFAVKSENALVGVGNSIPVYWTGDFSKLPAQGLDWAMEKAVDDKKEEQVPNLLVAVQILINFDLRSKGLSYELLDSMKLVARNNGIKHIALPVRPTLKHIYPLIPMQKYIEWTNEKGEQFDPWLRVHIKAGGKIVSICSESMKIQGEISEWKEWTGLNFQSSGLYTIENALCPINIDLANNLGEYIEPNVWIIHST